MDDMKKDLISSLKEREQVLIKLNEACPVCMDPYTPGTAYFLTNCTHVMHKECIKGYITSEIDGGKPEITCVDPKCKKLLAPEDVFRNTSDD